ncbi:MAG TPA: hypothetical protein VFA50_04930 [Stellaceae bacterium]|nr:hypothetical protein [Stellaceae bacterium]
MSSTNRADSPPALAQPGRIGGWTLLRRLVGRLDSVSRWGHGIFEFSRDPRCILRVAVKRADKTVVLEGGIVVAAGEPIAELHLWNEHVPALTGVHSLAWVAEIRRRLHFSLRELATAFEREERLRAAHAVRARPTLFPGQSAAKLMRVLAASSFEPVPFEDRGAARRWQRRIDDCWLFALAWAFNPRSVRGRPPRKERYECWISTPMLLAKFGAQRSAPD